MTTNNSKFFKPKRKALFLITMGCLTAGAFKAHLWQRGRYKESLNRWDKIHKAIENFTPQLLKDELLEDFLDKPRFEQDISNTRAKSWEFKLVELEGEEKEEKFIIERAKEGRMGAFLLKPFELKKKKSSENEEEYDAIFVNHGWIPKEEIMPFLKGDIAGTTSSARRVNQSTVVGLLRRGEPEDKFRKELGKGDILDIPLFNTFDLSGMTRIAETKRIHNKLYLEKIVVDIDDENESLYPVPFTKETFNRPYLMPEKHLDYSRFWAGATGIGIFAILSVIRK